ncbi:MAG: endonuclease/exonuclease/phosphatase family protein [Phycisphaerales bacterium]
MLKRLLVSLSCLIAQQATAQHAAPNPVTLRVATFNIHDVRTTDLVDGEHPRLKAIAEVIQRIRPNVILLNEIAYDQKGAPGFSEGDAPGQNAIRFINNYLIKPQSGMPPIRYQAFMEPVNTGLPSGFDMDRDGTIATSYTFPAESSDDNNPTPLPEDAKKYANDCRGYGGFPGQYGMALLVDERLEILKDQARTFRLIPWDYVSGALLPLKPDNTDWLTQDEKNVFPLSSKSHWDVPVKLPNGSVLHVLCSHPTPPAFDGPEMRNKKRNHDEIRFWRDYIDNAPYVVDDQNEGSGLRRGSYFVILGDLNADPKKGDSYKNPIDTQLLSSNKINGEFTPVGDVDLLAKGFAPEDTADFKLRVDYVLPSASIDILKGGVWRTLPTLSPQAFPSDHFPVWLDISVPEP